MRFIRFVSIALAAGALVLAGGCKSTTRTTTTTETSSVAPATVPDNTSMTSSNTTTTSSTTLATNDNTSSSTLQSSTPTTTTDNNGTTTTTMPDGTTVTRSQTTTVVYPNGTVQSIPGNTSQTSSSSLTTTSTSTTADNTLPVLPPGAAIVTKTVTTIKTQPATTQVAQMVPQPIYITTTPANVYQTQPPQPPMTSSTTTIYQPYRSGHGRRFPGVNFLIFADRASFSNKNSSLNGTVDTGVFSSDIRHEDGYGAGLNFYLGRTNLSTEFTYSNIRPRATLTPANANFNPITDFRFKMQPITGTLQLHFNPRSSVDFYVGGGGAYVMFKPDNSFNPGTSGLTGVRFRDEWGPLVNAGIGFGFSPNFGLNFDAKYMWVRANATPTFSDVTIGNVGNSSRIGVNPFVVSAGLRFGF